MSWSALFNIHGSLFGKHANWNISFLALPKIGWSRRTSKRTKWLYSGLRDLVWLRRMTLTLSEWHEVKVDENLCVGPAFNSTRVRFLIKSQFVNRCNADNEYSPEFIAPPKSCIFSVLFVSQCRKVRTALSKLAGRQVGMASPPLPPSLPSSPRLMIVRQSAPPRALCMPPPPAFLGLPLNKRQVWQLLTHIKCKLWRNRALHVPILRSCCSNLCLATAPPPLPPQWNSPTYTKKAIIVRSYIQRWFEYNWRAAIKDNSRLKNHFEILPLLITRSLGPATQWLRQPPFNIHQSHQRLFLPADAF